MHGLVISILLLIDCNMKAFITVVCTRIPAHSSNSCCKCTYKASFHKQMIYSTVDSGEWWSTANCKNSYALCLT